MIRSRRTATTLRTGFVALGAAIVGAVGLAGPALADITVSPGEAVQGGATTLTFRIPNERPKAYTTKVEVALPDANPIAEVYPLSVPDWAPQLTTRELPQAISQVHGTLTSEVTSAITWIAVGQGAFKPGQPQELRVDMGPLPNISQLAFTVTQTYSDGTMVRWTGATPGKNPAPVLKLLPGDGTTSHSGHTTDTGTAAAAPGGQAADTTATSTSSGSGIAGNGFALALAGAGLVAGLLIGVVVARGRRNPELAAVLDSDGAPDDPALSAASNAEETDDIDDAGDTGGAERATTAGAKATTAAK
jgi:uncharacterized protein YcnI